MTAQREPTVAEERYAMWCEANPEAKLYRQPAYRKAFLAGCEDRAAGIAYRREPRSLPAGYGYKDGWTLTGEVRS